MGKRATRNAILIALLAAPLTLGLSACSSPTVTVYDEIPPEMVAAAMRYQITENWYPALVRWEELLNEYPDYPDALYNKGICHEMLQDFSRAIECYEMALSLDPSNPRIKYALANALLAERQPKRGRQLMLELTENDPYYALGWYGLAAAERNMNRFQAALDAIDRCLEIMGEGNSDADPTEYTWARDAYWLKILILLDLDPQDKNGRARAAKSRMEAQGFRLTKAEEDRLAGRASSTLQPNK